MIKSVTEDSKKREVQTDYFMKVVEVFMQSSVLKLGYKYRTNVKTRPFNKGISPKATLKSPEDKVTLEILMDPVEGDVSFFYSRTVHWGCRNEFKKETNDFLKTCAENLGLEIEIDAYDGSNTSRSKGIKIHGDISEEKNIESIAKFVRSTETLLRIYFSENNI